MYLKGLFDKYNGEFNKFELIDNKLRLSDRPDIHALLIFDKLLKGNYSLIAEVVEETLYFNIDKKELLDIITEDQVRDLCRCGVYYSSYSNRLTMFIRNYDE